MIAHFLIPLKKCKNPKEIFSSDSKEFGGYGILNDDIEVDSKGIRLTLPPLSTVVIQIDS